MALHLFLGTLMTVNEIAPSRVSIVADNAQAVRCPKLSKSKRAAIDASVHKEKSRWSATASPSRPGTVIKRSVSDSVLSRPKRATSPEREETRNASWDDNRCNEPGSTKTSAERCHTSRAQTPSLYTGAGHTRKSLHSISEACCNSRDLLSSSPAPETTRTMQRVKSLDSKLYNNRIDLHMSQKKNFQETEETPRNAAASRIKSDSLRQALGMMAPSVSKQNSNLKRQGGTPKSLRTNSAKSPSSQGLGGPREKSQSQVRSALGSTMAPGLRSDSRRKTSLMPAYIASKSSPRQSPTRKKSLPSSLRNFSIPSIQIATGVKFSRDY